jgi:tetratricopeptide (TPR) repeat protein
LEELQSLLAKFSAEHDCALVYSDNAIALADVLGQTLKHLQSGRRVRRRQSHTLDVLCAIGELHWDRYLCRLEGEDLHDLQNALAFFQSVYAVQPVRVPEAVRRFFDSAPRTRPGAGPTVTAEQALWLLQQALSHWDPVALDASIIAYEIIMVHCPIDHPFRAEFLSNLSVALTTRFQRTGAHADIDRAIEISEQAVRVTAGDDPGRAMRLANLAMALVARFEFTGTLADLDQAIQLTQQALGVAPTDGPERGVWMSNLCMLLRYRFERTDTLTDLDRAIDAGEQAVVATPPDEPNRANHLYNLAAALHVRFSRTGALADLDRAVELAEETAAIIPVDHPNRADCLGLLGTALAAKARRTDQFRDLDRAVDLIEEAIAAAQPGSPHRVEWLGALLVALILRYEQTSKAADLDRAVAIANEAVSATPGNSHQWARLANLAQALRSRFESTDALVDLDHAIDLYRQAAGATSTDDPSRTWLLNATANALFIRYRRTGEAADLDRAIDFNEQALEACPANHAKRATLMSELGVSLATRFERTDMRADLDRAIDLGEQAVAITSTRPPEFRACATNLGLCLRQRYESTGEPADLDRAIDLGEQVVAAMPAKGLDTASHCYNLGGLYALRFSQSSALADLNRAIELAERAVGSLPADHPKHAMYLSDLGSAVALRYWRTNSLADLDRAVELGEQTVAATPAGHADRARRLNNAGTAHRLRYMRTSDLDHANRAIELGEQAVTATLPEDELHRAQYLSDLGTALRLRYSITGELADLEHAIDIGNQAVGTTSVSHPLRSRWLIELGLTWQTQYSETGEPADLAHAVESFKASFGIVEAPPIMRAHAANAWGLAAIDASDWLDSVEGFSQAVRLLAEIAPRSLMRADQEYGLTQLAGVGSNAAAACLQAGLPEKAVELIEQGRGVLFAQILDSHTDLTDLARIHTTQAEMFVRLTSELNQPDSANIEGFSSGHRSENDLQAHARASAKRRREAHTQLQELLLDIRSRSGFEKFMLPLSADELLPAANKAPVVLLNVAQLRSDALILHPAGIEVVKLTGVNPSEVLDRVGIFLRALDSVQRPDAEPALLKEAENRITDVLAWLWDNVTAPVLDRLGLTRTPDEGQPWPQIYWCPAGPLAFLPLHAAGYHAKRSESQPATVIDRVISSTVPTVRTLLQARHSPALSQDQSGTNDWPRLLLVAMPTTPGQPDLPGATKEAELLISLSPGAVDILGLPGTTPATYDTVTAALPHHPWAHFSCHGASSLDDPSSSQLILQDYQSHPLTVLHLSQARLEGIDLAFLSACTTARSGANLPDEPIHLAAACLLAGYRHVIATLWPIDDIDAVAISRAFYTSLTTGQVSRRADNAAACLHHATRRLRRLYLSPHQPSRWAAHIHMGP